MPIVFRGAAMLAGAGLIAYGAYLLSASAGVIVGGVLLIAGSAASAWRR